MMVKVLVNGSYSRPTRNWDGTAALASSRTTWCLASFSARAVFTSAGFMPSCSSPRTGFSEGAGDPLGVSGALSAGAVLQQGFGVAEDSFDAVREREGLLSARVRI